MSSPLEFARRLFGLAPADTIIKAPVGAWIPPQGTGSSSMVSMSEAGRPVMDAAQAHVHNATLFSGMATWGPLTGLAIVALAFVWSRFLRH